MQSVVGAAGERGGAEGVEVGGVAGGKGLGRRLFSGPWGGARS